MSKDWVEELMRLMCVRGLIPDENIEAALQLKQSHYPDALYKFRGIDGNSLSNLRDRTLYLAFASSFNDPYDSAVNFDPNFGMSHVEILLSKTEGISDIARKAILDADDPLLEFVRQSLSSSGNDDGLVKFTNFLSESNRKFLAKMKAKMTIRVQNTYKVCSLTERLDSLPLWSHYAKGHTGIAMEYDFKSLPFDDLMSISLWPVRYGGIFDATEMLRGTQTGQPFNNMFALVAALHKSPDWAYEQEWRLVLIDGSNQPGRSFKVPLKAVYLGADISEEHAAEVAQAAAVAGVPVYQMRLVPHEFRMEAVPHPL